MSYHDDFKRGLDEDFRNSPTETGVYWDALHKMNTGFFPRSYIDIVVQPSSRRYDIYDAWVFAQIHTMASGGKMQILRVEVGCEPAADNAVAKNVAALSKLPTPFHGTFWGGRHDFDGHVSWDEPVDVAGERWEPQVGVCLEVGTTRCATTWLHLCQTHWLARWPYGSTDMYIIRWKTQPSTNKLLALLKK